MHLLAADRQGRTGKFAIIEELNRGGMGVVLRGRDRGLHREVVFRVHRSPAIFRNVAQFFADLLQDAPHLIRGCVGVADDTAGFRQPQFALGLNDHLKERARCCGHTVKSLLPSNLKRHIAPKHRLRRRAPMGRPRPGLLPY